MLSEDEFYFVGVKMSGFRARYSFEELPAVGADDIGYHSCFFPGIMTAVGQKGCQAGVTSIGIQSNGNVKSCLSLSDEYIEGNIRQRNLEDIWRDRKSFRVYRHFQKSNLVGFCASCEYGEICQGGCSDMANSLTGNPYDNPYCFYRIEKGKMKGGNQNVTKQVSTAD